MKKLLLLVLCLFAVVAKAAVPAPPASAAETAAGTDRYKYVTPYGLANAGILGGGGGGTTTTNNATLLSGFLLGGNGARGATNVAVGTGLSLSGGVLTAPGGGLAVGDLSVTNYIPRVLISDATPQDPYRWMNATNGFLNFPAWSSARISGSQVPGVFFSSITNGATLGQIDVQHDHAAGGRSEMRFITLWDMALVPGYNSGIQIGASTDHYNQTAYMQYGNRIGWSHLFSFRTYTNGQSGSSGFALQGRRPSTSTNSSELHGWASEPTWNSFPTDGFSDEGVKLFKFAIDGSYFYSTLYGPLIVATNRFHAGLGTRWGNTDGGLELTGGYNDSFIIGGDTGASTRSDGTAKSFWLTMPGKANTDAHLNIASGTANGSSSTLNIGGGTGVKAPFASVKIWAGADSTVAGAGSLGINVTSGLVTTTNLVASQITGNGIGITNMLGWNTNIAAANSVSNNLNVTLGGNVAVTGTLTAGGLTSATGGSFNWYDWTSAGQSAGAAYWGAFAVDGTGVYGPEITRNDVGTVTQQVFRVDVPIKGLRGIATLSTNYIANANTAGYTNSAVAPGIGGTNNMVARVVGTSGTLEFYKCSGANGATVAGVGVFTNTFATSTWHIPVPVNCGFIIRSGVGVDIQVY